MNITLTVVSIILVVLTCLAIYSIYEDFFKNNKDHE